MQFRVNVMLNVFIFGPPCTVLNDPEGQSHAEDANDNLRILDESTGLSLSGDSANHICEVRCQLQQDR